jgi:hypothetical protein
MKHVLFLSILTAFAALQGWAQNNSPEEKSIVNKKYDENGNLIQYDSTYIWQWNSDSTMNFSFGDNFVFGNDFPGMFGEFFNDSIFEQFGLRNEPFFHPFGDDDFFRHFEHSFPGFPSKRDSTFNFGFGKTEPFNFDFKELEDLHKQLQEKFGQQHLLISDFKTPEQQKEWQEMMQKQQKEKEELMKKWGKL